MRKIAALCMCALIITSAFTGLAAAARKNFLEAGLSERLRLIEDDATVVLECLSGPYDMIFLDAAKGQYPDFLPHCVRLLPPGGLLVCDNVFYRGMAGEEGFVPHKMRTMVTRLRAFRRMVQTHEALDTSIVDIEDGLSVSIKR
jgi:predicted O-methyltransferase YrrM